MGTNDAPGSSTKSAAIETVAAELANLAEELNALTDLMESEWNERRIITTDHARRLGELRKRFEQLIEA
jgi:hypothetical protein